MNAAELALVSAGGFLLVGMATGVWKYRHIMRSESAQAPVYVDICHRASLMYAFASLILQQLALQSVWSNLVNTVAVGVTVAFFASAILTYALHGLLQDTDNQLQRPHRLGRHHLPGSMISLYMGALILGEMGGTAVLLAGAIRAL